MLSTYYPAYLALTFIAVVVVVGPSLASRDPNIRARALWWLIGFLLLALSGVVYGLLWPGIPST